MGLLSTWVAPRKAPWQKPLAVLSQIHDPPHGDNEDVRNIRCLQVFSQPWPWQRARSNPKLPYSRDPVMLFLNQRCL